MREFKGKYCTDCKVYADYIEDAAIDIINELVNNKIFEKQPIRIMPDVHAGKGSVIGFTAPLHNNTINPEFVGVDIGCTVSLYVLNIPVVKEDLPLIEHRIRKEIPFGFDICEQRKYEMKDMIKFLKKEYNSAMASWDILPSVDLSEKGLDTTLKRINISPEKFYKSIGTVGGGNHFIEIGENDEGNYVFTIHCGSRNFGAKVCEYWTTRCNEDKLLEGDDFVDYLSDMVIAQAYAKYNHKIIADTILDIFKKKYKKVKIVDEIMSVHNYIDMHDHIIRKGAIRSYKGEKMIIPFNMRDGLAVCVGKSNKEWNCSAPHGTGRKMSRTIAKRDLSLKEFQEQMKDICTTSVCQTTLDEAPNAYKDKDEILNIIKDTCDILCFVKPIINLKDCGQKK